MTSYHNKDCIICGNKATPAHIKGRGAFGDDLADNMIPLCGGHHTEQGQCGFNTFVDRYPIVRVWLIQRGWEFDDFIKKWRKYESK